MKKIKILIVEDEIVIAEDIKYMLEEIGYEVIGITKETSEALDKIDKHSPDLILLDILLYNGSNGIDLAKLLKDKYNKPFIFITAHSDKQTVERAKLVNPNGYLVKPFEKEDLYTSIEIALANYLSNQDSKNNYKKINSFIINDYIFIKKDHLMYKVKLNDIKWIKSDGNYLDLYCTNSKHLIRATVRDFVEKLPKDFIQVHRSYIVNTDCIDALGHRVIKIGKTHIPIGNLYVENVQESFDIIL